MTRNEVMKLAQLFRDAIAAADGVRMRAALSPNCVIWYNQFGSLNKTMSREEAVSTVLGMQKAVQNFRYTEVRVEPTESGFVQQSIILCRTNGGKELAVPLCLVAVVGISGQIDRYDEYSDSAHLAPLMAEMYGTPQDTGAK